MDISGEWENILLYLQVSIYWKITPQGEVISAAVIWDKGKRKRGKM
jgi:predicted ABC-type sugar transport system permease subunit